jgi:lambda family phage portal protein
MRLRESFNRGIETAIKLVSPRRAFEREHWRRMRDDWDYRETVFALMRTQGYRAAKPGSSTTPFRGGTASADAELLADLPTLRNRSRELNQDDPIGSGLTETFVRNVVGKGLRPRARTGDTSKDENIEAIWRERQNSLSLADNLTCAELQQMWVRAYLQDGETLPKRTKRTADDPVWFETVESDRLATPGLKSVAARGENEVRDGVEKDKWGVPVKYWIAKQHPGDLISAGKAGDWNSYEPITPDAIRHWKATRRPGQTRGEPMFHAVMQDIRDLDLLMLAALKRSQIAACLAAFITSDLNSQGMLGSALIAKTAEKHGFKLDQDIEPGMIFKLNPGEKIETLIPNFPTPELRPFIIMIARRIGAALGVSWQVVLKDFSDSTYSSARADLLESRMVYKLLRQSLISNVLGWVWTEVLTDAQLRGDVRAAGLSQADMQAVQWFGDGWELIDKLKEYEANAVALQTCQVTLEHVWLEAGLDPDQMWEALRKQAESLKEIGMTITFTPVQIQQDEPPKRELGTGSIRRLVAA